MNHIMSCRGTAAAVVLAAALFGLPAPVRALDAPEREALSRGIAATRVVEIPASISRAVRAASEKDRTEVATTVVVAAVRAHPAILGPAVLAAVEVDPAATDAVVVAALETAPGGALSLISSAAEREDEVGDLVIAAAERRFPHRAASFEREVAVVRTLRWTRGAPSTSRAATAATAAAATSPGRATNAPATPPEAVRP